MTRPWKPNPKKIAKYLNPWMFKREKAKQRVAKLRTINGDNCWRCHAPMNFTEPRNKRRSATIEHLTARAHGGNSAIDNIVLCHRGCNQHLGANTREQKERMRSRSA
jgi:nitrate/TMAO reductase-like tetraheme cytochrome c subunit